MHIIGKRMRKTCNCWSEYIICGIIDHLTVNAIYSEFQMELGSTFALELVLWIELNFVHFECRIKIIRNIPIDYLYPLIQWMSVAPSLFVLFRFCIISINNKLGKPIWHWTAFTICVRTRATLFRSIRFCAHTEFVDINRFVIRHAPCFLAWYRSLSCRRIKNPTRLRMPYQWNDTNKPIWYRICTFNDEPALKIHRLKSLTNFIRLLIQEYWTVEISWQSLLL